MKSYLLAGLLAVVAIPIGGLAYNYARHETKVGVRLVNLQVTFAGEPRAISQAEVTELLGSSIHVDPVSKRVGDTYWLTLEVPSEAGSGELATHLEKLSDVSAVQVK